MKVFMINNLVHVVLGCNEIARGMQMEDES
jgi:hypothetical protein